MKTQLANKNTQKRKMEKGKEKMEKGKMKVSLAEAIKSESCGDKNCNIHGNLKSRGRIFEGIVKKKFQKRVVIEFERMIFIRKYERYKKSKTKIHARLPDCLRDRVNIGDLIKVQECRPLSKIIHFVVIEKIKSGGEK